MNAAQDLALSSEERAALDDARPTLRRFPLGFARAPASARLVYHRAHVVRALVARGLLRWGNKARSYVMRAEASAAPRELAALRQALAGELQRFDAALDALEDQTRRSA